MIANRVERSGQRTFKDLARYILDVKDRSEKVRAAWTTHCAVEDDFDFAVLEIEATQQLNVRSKIDKTYHLVVSLAAGENLTDAEFKAIEKRYCDAIGLGEHQRICAIHTDTDHIHMHIALSKVHHKKLTSVEPFYDKLKLTQVSRELEKKYGLKSAIGPERQPEPYMIDRHQGLESFAGYVRKNLVPELSKLLTEADVNWQKVQSLAARFGVEIRQHGAGLVFSHLEKKLFVKASSVEPSFSKKRLEDLLGPYERLEAVADIQMQYERRPLGMSPGGNTLFAEYQAEARKTRDLRQQKLAQLYKARADKISEIKQSYAKRRSEVRIDAMLGGAAKARVRQKLALEMKKEIETCVQRSKTELARVRAAHATGPWKDWLRQKSDEGNEQALAALRAASKEILETGPGQITGDDIKTDVFRGRGRKVSKHGAVEYPVGDGKIIDTGKSLVVKDLNPATLQAALRMGQAKFGESIQISGTDEFISAMVRLAPNLQPKSVHSTEPERMKGPEFGS